MLELAEKLEVPDKPELPEKLELRLVGAEPQLQLLVELLVLAAVPLLLQQRRNQQPMGCKLLADTAAADQEHWVVLVVHTWAEP
jgi:hypothetical protein